MKRVLLLLLLLVSCAYGAGKGGIGDLKWPFINFALLFGFIIWKVKDPLREAFKKNYEDTKQLYNLAHERDKEAQIKLKMYREKMDEVEVDCEKIVEQGKVAVNSFKENYQRECVAKRERFKVEEEGKIKQYKLQGQRKLKEVVVEKIVARVEEKVKGKHSLKNKISKKLLSQVKLL